MGKKYPRPEDRFFEDVDFVRRTGLLDIFLMDRTTGRNIIWATGEADEEKEIMVEDILGRIKPRWLKNEEARKQRMRMSAEVFTPSGICREMVKTIEGEESRPAKDFSTSLCLEITCGEAPFIASRYDMETGKSIEVKARFGFLDKKLEGMREEDITLETYRDRALRSLKSVYGYELHGDSLFMARINVFMDFVEHWNEKWTSNPDSKVLEDASEVVSWNFWQMDGLGDFLSPLKTAKKSLETLPGMELGKYRSSSAPCKIRLWDNEEEVEFRNLFRNDSGERKKSKKEAVKFRQNSSLSPLFPFKTNQIF